MSLKESSQHFSWEEHPEIMSPHRTPETDSRTGLSDDSSSTLMRPKAFERRTEVDELSITKLRFDKVKLHGRTAAIQQLRTRISEKKRHLCTIGGFPGTGKTVLAESARTFVSDKGGLFSRGKFEMDIESQRPYSAIAMVCAEIIGQLMHAGESASDVRKSLASQTQELLGIVPQLAEIMGGADSEREHDINTATPPSIGNKDYIIFAFQRFFRIIAKSYQPFAFVIDDLQWSNRDDLDVLEALLCEQTDDIHFTMIVTYRSDEVDKDHGTMKFIESIRSRADRSDILKIFEEIIGDLGPRDVQEIVQELLSIDADSRCKSLTELCLKKTGGNPFYLIQFFRTLHLRGLLSFNISAHKWLWDESEILKSTTSTNNVVDLLTLRMESLSSDKVFALQLASALGTRFDQTIFCTVWDGIPRERTEDVLSSDPIITLHQLRNDGFFEELGDGQFYWVHDQIQQAAGLLVSPSSRASFNLRVGQTILREVDPRTMGDALIFVTANLLNGGGVPVEKANRLQNAKVNLRACKRAKECSAFVNASSYAKSGTGYLDLSSWEDDYDLTLELHTLGAEIESLVGNIDQMKVYCKVIFDYDHAKENKLRAYVAWIYGHIRVQRRQEAYDLSLHVLKQFGIRFPKNKIILVSEVVRKMIWAKSLLRKKEKIRALTAMTIDTPLYLMKILDKLSLCCYYLKSDILPLVVFKALSMTMVHGYCEYSPVALGTTGVIFSGVLEDFTSGTTFAEEGIRLFSLGGCSDSTKSRVLFVSSILYWTLPMHKLIKMMQSGYEIGLRSGDSESASLNALFAIVLRFQLGSDLHQLEQLSRIYASQMRYLKCENPYDLLMPLWQMILNLTGRCDDALTLKGEAMTETQTQKLEHDEVLSVICDHHRYILLTLLGEYEICAEVVSKRGLMRFFSVSPGSIDLPMHYFACGLSCFIAGRRLKHRRYLSIARKAHKKMKTYVRKGCVNASHLTKILDAERALVQGRSKEAIHILEGSVVFAARNGLSWCAAVANERLADIYMATSPESEERMYRLSEAAKYYSLIGATEKVRRLEAKYGNLIEDRYAMNRPREVYIPEYAIVK